MANEKLTSYAKNSWITDFYVYVIRFVDFLPSAGYRRLSTFKQSSNCVLFSR